MLLSLDISQGGPGTPVLLLHGQLLHRGTMAFLHGPLSRGAPCAALDLPWHGDGLAPAEPRFSEFTEAVRAALDALGWRRVQLLGFSLGGIVAQAFSRMAPERVERQVLVGTPLRFDAAGRAGMRQVAEVLGNGMGRSVAELVAPLWLSEAYRRATPDHLLRLERLVERNVPASARLAALATAEAPMPEAAFPVETHLVAMEADVQASVQQASEVAVSFGGTVHTVPGGHLAAWEQPVALIALVERIVALR